MAAPPVRVTIAQDTLTPYLQGLANPDLTPLMADLVLQLDSEVQQAFADQADPLTGAPWEPLDPDYVARPRAKGGRGGDATPILIRDANLSRPDPAHGADFAELIFGEVYAALHNFGPTAGMAPGPAAVVARRYLGLSKDGVKAIADIGAAYLLPK
jgi:phage virion morphogenesis protein